MQEGGGKYSQLCDTRRAEGITSLSGEAASAGDSHDLEARCCTTPSPLDAPQTLLDLQAGGCGFYDLTTLQAYIILDIAVLKQNRTYRGRSAHIIVNTSDHNNLIANRRV